jgi:hypothetical protein
LEATYVFLHVGRYQRNSTVFVRRFQSGTLSLPNRSSRIVRKEKFHQPATVSAFVPLTSTQATPKKEDAIFAQIEHANCEGGTSRRQACGCLEEIHAIELIRRFILLQSEVVGLGERPTGAGCAVSSGSSHLAGGPAACDKGGESRWLTD